jgi:LPXTG-motif cell wall-anchored protein
VSSDNGNTPLAYTGVSVLTPLGIGVGLIAAGAGLLLYRRRRTS